MTKVFSEKSPRHSMGASKGDKEVTYTSVVRNCDMSYLRNLPGLKVGRLRDNARLKTNSVGCDRLVQDPPFFFCCLRHLVASIILI